MRTITEFRGIARIFLKKKDIKFLKMSATVVGLRREFGVLDSLRQSNSVLCQRLHILKATYLKNYFSST